MQFVFQTHVRIFLTVLAIVSFCLIRTPIVKADSGTCSDHGGVDCSAMADSDGSAICNDGWRDSSEAFFSVQECQNLHHTCTTAEFNQINLKYDLAGLNQKVTNIYNQMAPLAQQSLASTDSNTIYQITAEVLNLKQQYIAADADYWSATNKATLECWALGDAEYQQRQANLITQYSKSLQQSQPAQTELPPPISSLSPECLSPNSHYISSTQCACDAGYLDTANGYCATISEYCILTLGGRGIPISASTCGCPAGYVVGTETVQGTSMNTCLVIAHLPSVKTSSATVASTTAQIPTMIGTTTIASTTVTNSGSIPAPHKPSILQNIITWTLSWFHLW